MKTLLQLTILSLLAVTGMPFTSTIQAQMPQGIDEQQFKDPPNSARPRVWWHWMNGNISEAGIKLDLEWMHRIGIGGFQQFDAGINTPQVVEKRLTYMTPEWKSAFRLAIQTADNLGLEAAIASSPGWSETGGPWVPPADAMKKLVWSETTILNGQPLPMTLSHPPINSGGFQNFPVSAKNGVGDYYKDIIVLAYPTPSADLERIQDKAKVTVSDGKVDANSLTDGSIGVTAATLNFKSVEQGAWIQFAFSQPTSIQAISIATLGDMLSLWSLDTPPSTTLSSSRDGIHFEKIVDLPRSTIPQRTADFPARTATFFRITFERLTAKPGTPSTQVKISELSLFTGARVNRFEEKAGFATNPNYYTFDTPPTEERYVVPPANVLDLSSKLHPDGSLDWLPPPGNWTILRIGSSLTGKKNAPAPPEATGLEVDKLDAGSVRRYMENYLSTYQQTVSPALMGKHGVEYMLTDSIEAGSQNWTPKMLEEFQSRRGYNPRPWLPVLTGTVVGSSQQSDRFLWDYRQTIAELLAANHYGTIASFLHEHGMKIYGEALESYRPNLGDDIDMRRFTDIPMGAMWTYPVGTQPKPSYIVDIRGAASIAHIYGQNIVGVEAMTSAGPAWGFAPSDLKHVVDMQFLVGANMLMIHESSHQPLIDKAPGLTLGQYGQWFNRNETWAEQAKPWIDYISRSSYMLQAGRGYADIAYFYGQEGPLTGLYGWSTQTDAPQGFGFDFVNATMLQSALTVKDHQLVSQSGASFRILQLGGRSQRLTLSVLLRLKSLLEQGAIVVGDRPNSSPSLSDDDQLWNKLVTTLWGEGNSSKGMRRIGQGELWQGISAVDLLNQKGIQPDFTFDKKDEASDLRFVHRKVAEKDLYFVSNQSQYAEDTWVTLRVTGKSAEIWHADTGLIEPASYEISNGHTRVHVYLAPGDAVFVVFRHPTKQSLLHLPEQTEKQLATLPEDWVVSFQPDRGAPGKLHFDHLATWSTNPDLGVRYFSGHATYEQTITVPQEWIQAGQHIWLDLGQVCDLAEVSVNGKPLGQVWKSPYRVEVTSALQPGANQIAITITNLWVNRLIGDQQTNTTKAYTFTPQHPYTADSPLRKSGLLGPVTLLQLVK